jgi:hypothetical protein
MTPLKSSPLAPTLPLTTRLPKTGQKEPISGLGRTQLDLLVRPQAGNGYSAPVRSHILAVKGNSRGIRLIDVQSLVTYISSLSSEQPGKKGKRRRKATASN